MVEAGDVLEAIGCLVALLNTYSAKVPAVSHRSVVAHGMKPSPEAIGAYESTVFWLRKQATDPVLRRLNGLFIESLEAFESGWVLRGVQALLIVLDQLEAMHAERTIVLTQAVEDRLREYRMGLYRVLPGNEPELEGAGKGLRRDVSRDAGGQAARPGKEGEQ